MTNVFFSPLSTLHLSIQNTNQKGKPLFFLGAVMVEILKSQLATILLCYTHVHTHTHTHSHTHTQGRDSQESVLYLVYKYILYLESVLYRNKYRADFREILPGLS